VNRADHPSGTTKTTVTMRPDEQLATILPMLTKIVGHIEPSQLDGATPCTKFTVRGVLDHMIAGATTFAPSFRGTGARGEAASPPPDEAHPAARFRAAMADLLDAVQSPGALTRTVESPFGPIPGAVFARFVVFDGLVHGWDLASSTGQPYEPPEDVVAATYAFALEAITPAMRDGDTFADEKQAPVDAGTLTKLVAFSGRGV
jgi:uncharacterized protein (TIGR03086 family)